MPTAFEPLNYQQPDWNVSETLKDEEWWKQNIRFYSTYYGRPYQTYDGVEPFENYSPVQKGLAYCLYYIGKQRNINYNHVTQDPSGNSMQAIWTKTKKVNNLVNRLAEQYASNISAKEISAKSFSKTSVNAKMKAWEDEMMRWDSKGKKLLDAIEQASGIKYQSPYADKINSQEDAERFLTYDLKDDFEEAAIQLAKYLEWANDSDTQMIQAFIQDFCPANWMAHEWYVENGKIKQMKLPFYNTILDPLSDDPFMRDSRFIGKINRMSPQQAESKWGKRGTNTLSATEIEEIKAISKGGGYAPAFLAVYNTGNIGWWENGRDNYLISAVTVYWNAPRDTRYIYDVDNHGNKKLMKAGDKEKNKTGDYIIDDLHYATLLGNKYLVEWGYMNNVVRPIESKDRPEFPIKVFNGNTMLGDGVSIIGSIAQLIDKMDRCEYKIDEITGNIGKTYVFNGAKFPTGVDMKKMTTELKTMKITVSEPSGENRDASDNQPLATPLDFSMDEAIIEYSNLSMKYERMVEDLLNLPKVAQGLDSNTGMGVQQGVIAQSSKGNATLMTNLVRYNEINLQYAINLAKIVWGDKNEGDELASFVIGDRGKKLLSIIKKYRWEDILVKISQKDTINAQQKQQAIGIAQAAMQNGQIDMLDFIDVMQSETFVEMKNDIEFRMKKRQEKVAEQQAAAQQAAQKEKMDAISLNNKQQQDTVNLKEQHEDTRNLKTNQRHLMQQDLKNKKETAQ